MDLCISRQDHRHGCHAKRQLHYLRHATSLPHGVTLVYECSRRGVTRGQKLSSTPIEVIHENRYVLVWA
jgi:hypothetical protein